MGYRFHSGKWPRLLQERIRMGLLEKINAPAPSSRRRWGVWGKTRQSAGRERTVLWLWYPKWSPQEQILPLPPLEPPVTVPHNLAWSPQHLMQLWALCSLRWARGLCTNNPTGARSISRCCTSAACAVKLLTRLWPGPFAVFQQLPGHSWRWPCALLTSNGMQLAVFRGQML